MTEKYFISVILPLKLEWVPCYYSTEHVDIGVRVSVSFAGKSYIGVVSGTGIDPDIDKERIKPIIAVETAMGKILEEEIELWRQVAGYYLCTVGEVYKAAYPRVKVNMEKAKSIARNKVELRRERILNAIDAKISRLEERISKKKELAEKSKEGTKAKANILRIIERAEEEIRYATSARMEIMKGGENTPSSDTGTSGMMKKDISLSDAQIKAYKEICEGFNEGKPVLLHGVTGSGKTEIYIRLAHESLASGKNVLYLVPEIALSRQLEDRLKEHFGARLITFHSGESTASRRDSAEAIRTASVENGGYVALCTRSGIFLPHHDLGLIIVDEEHDSSYKQDSPAPRYNGRDAALMLSRIHRKCRIILGSATPSLEEIYNARTGRHSLVRLTERFHGSDDTEIEIIDTKAESSKHGMVGNFSRKLIDHIRHAVEAGGQVLVLRSRRAWATAMQCSSCGEIQKCPHCNVSLSYHKSHGSAACHYCGYTTTYSGRCTKCGGGLVNLGAGTQKIEEEARVLFPNARIARLDADTTQNKALETNIIRDFASGKIDILIGTQIITKGFDFERLSLVAVISADALLGIQDFRADEKALHILEQFKGRCGRRHKRGLFVIQTAQPDHPIYMNMLHNRPEDSNNRLMMERKDFGFPPYTRIVEITVRDIFEDRVERMTGRLAARLHEYNIAGPYTPVVDKVADQHIRKIRISFNKDRFLVMNKENLKETISAFEKEMKYDSHITIDVDPA